MSSQSARSRTVALIGSDNTPTWFPASTPLTGILTSTNTKVIGTDTLFRDEINAGDFLVNASNIARKVQSVVSDTELLLELEFDSDLSGATCVRVKNQEIRHLRVIFITNPGEIKAASQDTVQAWPATTEWKTPETLDTYHEPYFVDPGAGGAYVIETI